MKLTTGKTWKANVTLTMSPQEAYNLLLAARNATDARLAEKYKAGAIDLEYQILATRSEELTCHLQSIENIGT